MGWIKKLAPFAMPLTLGLISDSLGLWRRDLFQDLSGDRGSLLFHTSRRANLRLFQNPTSQSSWRSLQFAQTNRLSIHMNTPYVDIIWSVSKYELTRIPPTRIICWFLLFVHFPFLCTCLVLFFSAVVFPLFRARVPFCLSL